MRSARRMRRYLAVVRTWWVSSRWRGQQPDRLRCEERRKPRQGAGLAVVRTLVRSPALSHRRVVQTPRRRQGTIFNRPPARVVSRTAVAMV
jgi:hypothetical protein